MQAQIKTWWILLIIASFITFILQIYFYLHMDILYLLHAAQLLLSGGNYSKDFFETNPPLILYWYMPALWLAKLSNLSVVIVFRAYILSLSIFSLFVCYQFLKKIILETWLQTIFLFLLLIGFLFLPAHEFGQREYLLMLVTFPYVFALNYRLTNQSISKFLAGSIGIFAGLGIALKPFFLSIPLCLELYYGYKKKSFLAVIRPETVSIGLVLSVYMGSTLIFFPDYFQTVLPVISHLYFPGMKRSLSYCFTDFYFDFSLLGIVFYLMESIIIIIQKKIPQFFYFEIPQSYQTTKTVLFIALIAFFIACLIPRACFYYHIMPAFITSFVLITFSSAQLLEKNLIAVRKGIGFVRTCFASTFFIIIVLILFIPLYNIIYTYCIIYKSNRDPSSHELIHFFNSHPGSSYTTFSSWNDSLLFHYYAKADYVGCYPSFWWEFGLLTLPKTPQLKQDYVFLIHLIAQNLQIKKPKFVLVDTVNHYPNLLLHPPDYLTEFSQVDAFKKVWINYHYQTTIGRFRIYEYVA